MRHLLPVLALALLVAGCSAPTPHPGPTPPPASSPPTAQPQTTTTAPDTRTLRPPRGLFSVEVPARFTDLPATSPQASAVPALGQALQKGVGVLAVDRRDGYSPTVGGFCTLVQAQDLTALAEETRSAIERSGSPSGPVEFTILPASGVAGQRISGTYRTAVDGRALTVAQVAGLAGPGRACLLTVSTDDPTRDAALLTTARDTFRMPG